ncbi:insulinase family protein [Leucothrix sargassi]|nr:insulinase family protein [Leucothrix sargassi]
MGYLLKVTATLSLVGSLFASSLAMAGPKIEHWTLDSGLRVYYVGIDDLPMLDINVTFDAGSARDGEKYGLANLTLSMLDEGAAGKNADELSEAFESLGANFYASASRDMASIGLRTITLEKPFEAAISEWLSVMKSPDFPESNLERLKKQLMVGFEAEKQRPSSIAGKAFRANLYDDHPYGQPSSGTEESIKDISVADLKAFYKQYIVEDNAMVSIVGKVSREQAEALAKRVADVLEAGKKPAPLPEVKPLTEAKTIHLPFPSSQATIIMGQTGYKRGDPDYFKLYLANHPFGGSGFTSRLMKEVRVKRGLSYGVSSYFSPSRELGPFVMSLQTKIEQIDEAKRVMTDLLKTYLKDGPTEEEIEGSKLNISGGFPMNIAGNSNISNYVDVIGFFGLPLDYLDRFTGEIDSITRDQAKEAMQRRVNPDAMLTVIVGGDPEASEMKDGKSE